jgi:hypothetical protein
VFPWYMHKHMEKWKEGTNHDPADFVPSHATHSGGIRSLTDIAIPRYTLGGLCAFLTDPTDSACRSSTLKQDFPS